MFKKNLKKVITLVLVASMMVGAAAGCGKGGDDTDPTPTPTTAAVNPGTTQTPDNPDVPDTYTYNVAAAQFPTNWNPHTYETATDSDILGYTSDGFFTFDYNETLDGYKLVPAMAVAEPVDVTSEYVGKYGIVEDDEAKVWKLTLRDDLKWDDGTPINAHDFVTSAKLLLDPIAQNYRADSLYQGSLALYNAKNYLYQGQHVYATHMINADYTEGYINPADYTFNENGVLYINGNTDSDVSIAITTTTRWSSNYSLEFYYNYSADYQACFVKDGVDLMETVFKANMDANGMVKATQEVIDAINVVIAQLQMGPGATPEDYFAARGDYAYQEWQEFAYIGATYAELDFAEVGVFATADNELVLAIEKPLEGFYLLYALTGSWLVKEDLYNSCASVVDGVYTSTYGTSAETTPSYGPYKLTVFQADKQYILEKNEYYYGLTDDTYMTTTIQVDYVAEAPTRLELFLKGQLDSYGLSASDMEEYQASDHTYYTTGDSTFFVAVNPDLTALEAEQAKLGENYNKTIITIKEFRQALSYSLDRAKFALATSPLNSPAFGVFSSTIISDPENGVAYRTTDEAKQVLVDFWGLSNDIGAGKLYATVDDAIESITGYNLAMGKQYFDKAYDIAIAEGLMDEDDKVHITIGLASATSEFYTKGYEFLVNCYTEAVVGTKLEGKLEFSKDDTIGNGFADALKSNQVNLLFGVGWTGSALDPYGLMEAYTSVDYQYDPSWDTTTEMITVNLNGVDYTASVWDWTLTMSGTPIEIVAADGTIVSDYTCGSSDEKPEERFQILTALEGAVLATYDLIPLIDDASAALKGMQIQYYTEDYIYGVGRGGVKYMTYNYTDAEWNDYVTSQGGTLNYK